MKNNETQKPCLKCKLILLAGSVLAARYIYEGIAQNQLVFIIQGVILLATAIILVKTGPKIINSFKKNEEN